MNPLRPRDPVTFTTPKGRVLTGTVLMVGSIYLAVKTSNPPLNFLLDKATLVPIGSS